jgi:hypothetical protein
VKKVLELLDKEKFQNKGKEKELKNPTVVNTTKPVANQPTKVLRVLVKLSENVSLKDLQKFMPPMHEYSTDLVKDKSCLLSNKNHAKLEIKEDEILLKEFKESLKSESKKDMITDKCADKVSSGHELEVGETSLGHHFHQS